MLKAIVTVMDENNRILQANRLIFEENSVPVGFGYITGIEHQFNFTVVTNEEMNKKEEERLQEERVVYASKLITKNFDEKVLDKIGEFRLNSPNAWNMDEGGTE